MRMSHTKPGRIALGAAAAAGVRHMAHRFIVGESPKDALRDLRELSQHGIASSVDLLGEATVRQAEADRYAERCADALDTIAAASEKWPEREALEAQLRQSQKLEGIGRLAGGIAHDFNNLLTAIIGYTQLMQRRFPPDHPATKDAGEVLGAAERGRSQGKRKRHA